MLHHFIRSVQDLLIKEVKHETGSEPRITHILAHHDSLDAEPFAASFQLTYFDHRGSHVYTVTISEAKL